MDSALEQRRSRCYDIAKVMTILLVVLGHATVFYTPDGAMAPARASKLMAGIANYIYSFHMPLFVLLSGCVWGYCIRHGKYRENLPFLKNKAKRLLIPYLFFGVVLVAPVVVCCGFTEEGFFGYLLRGILLGTDARHLWYLLVLFLLFLSTLAAKPLVRRNPLLTLPFCVVMFLVADRLPQLFKLRTAFKYALFFYLGVCADRWYPLLETLVRKLRFLLPALPVLLLGSVFWNPNFIAEMVYTLLGMGMILGFACLLTGSDALQNNPVYRFLKRNSFGLYLVHAMVIYLCFFLLGGTGIAPVLLVAISVIVSCAVSFGVILLLRKLKLGVLIGE